MSPSHRNDALHEIKLEIAKINAALAARALRASAAIRPSASIVTQELAYRSAATARIAELVTQRVALVAAMHRDAAKIGVIKHRLRKQFLHFVEALVADGAAWNDPSAVRARLSTWIHDYNNRREISRPPSAAVGAT